MKITARKEFPAQLTALLVYVTAATVGSFAGGAWATLGIAGSVLLFGIVWTVERKIPWPQREFAFFAFLTLAVMAALNFGSTQPHISWHAWTSLAGVFIPLMLLSSPAVQARSFHPEFIPLLFIAAVTGAASLGVELSLDVPLLNAVEGAGASPTDYNRGLCYLVLLAFPLMAGLRHGHFPMNIDRRIWLIVFFVGVLLFPAGLTDSRAGKLALLLGLGVTAAAHFFPVLMRRLLAAAAVLSAAWPFAAQKFFLSHYDLLGRFPDSWRARMEIWDYMSYRIMEKPWFGWGLGSAHTLDFKHPHGSQYVFTVIPASHSHNAMTQLWVELGLPGLALGIAFALMMLGKAGRLDGRLVPFALGAWAAAFCISLVAFDFWTDSLWAAFALCAFLFGMMQKEKALF